MSKLRNRDNHTNTESYVFRNAGRCRPHGIPFRSPKP